MGVVAYQVVTGKLPFDQPDLADLMVAVGRATPAPPKELQPELLLEASRLILQLLARDPGGRPTGAAKLGGRFRGLSRLFSLGHPIGGDRPAGHLTVDGHRDEALRSGPPRHATGLDQPRRSR